jgi:hypothetical protein
LVKALPTFTRLETNMKFLSILAAFATTLVLAVSKASAHHFYDVWLEKEGHPLQVMRSVLSEPSHFTALVGAWGLFVGLVFLVAQREGAGRKSRLVARSLAIVATLSVGFAGLVAFAP